MAQAAEPRALISRPASPTLVNDSPCLVNGGAVLAAALQKKMNRKRKANSIDNEVRFKHLILAVARNFVREEFCNF